MSGTLGNRAALPNPEGGCRIATFLLGDVERLETALAAYMVMTWRINRLMRLGRSLPELPADLLFEKQEWTQPMHSTARCRSKGCQSWER